MRWHLVIPGELYRSGQLSRTLVERELANHGIRVVVDLTARVPGDSDQEGELRACGALGIEHHRFPLKGDGTGDIRQYAGAVSRIHAAIQEGKPVLVHCVSGVQRTGGVLASYRLLVRGESPSIIHRELTEQGFGCHPVNPGVLTYLNAHMQELSGLLVQQGTLAASPSPLPVLAPATDGGNEQRLAERR
jgi:protein tyrosine/serine phosphatase